MSNINDATPVFNDLDVANCAVSGLAINVAANGLPTDLLLPIQPVFRHQETGQLAGGKKPAMPNVAGGWDNLNGWEQGVSYDDVLTASRAGCNIGLRLGMPAVQPPHLNLLALDLDMKEGHAGARDAFLAALERLTGAPVLWRETWPYRGLVLVSIATMEAPHIRNWRVELAGQKIGTIQLLACGQQCIVAGHHYSGNPIRWHHGGNAYQVPPVSSAGLPGFADYDALLAALDSVFASLRPYGLEFPLASAGSTGTAGGDNDVPVWLTVAKLADVLDRMSNPASFDRDQYTPFCQALAGCRKGIIAHHGPLSDADENRLADAVAGWAARWKGPKPGDFDTERAKWLDDWRDNGDFAGWRHLIDHAKKLGVDLAGDAAQMEFSAGPQSVPPPDPVAPQSFDEEREATADEAFTYSEEWLALRFSLTYANTLRHVAKWGKWLVWDGRRWEADETYRVFNLARTLCRQTAQWANSEDMKYDMKRAISSRGTARNVEGLAQADRRHAATTDLWDSDPWLLNTPAGIVNLRTGAIMRHDPAQHMTKITIVAPGGSCPQWVAFLDKITRGDRELQRFLQRVAGYCLTGVTREHALFFGYGTGGNGKGTFLNTLSWLMGDYAAIAPMDTFTASQGERHPADLAMLRGARLVTAQETEDGQQWAESKIKALTGGDPITARFMRQDFFTYVPAFKLFIAGNHKPGLRRVDPAIQRRMNLIPFTVQISDAERDAELPEKLQAEASGILAWAIEGCLEWQRIGLAPPESVRAATGDYLDAQDSMGAWLAECCHVAGQVVDGEKRPADIWAARTALYSSWVAWAKQAGEYPGKRSEFIDAMVARGFAEKRQPGTGTRGFAGVELIPPPDFGTLPGDGKRV